ncbi:MAG: hypothetical protein ACFFB3_20315 [Candidatus Hodarchaeota archaeon]
MTTPSSAYFFSRLSLMGHNLESGWLIDTWKVPMGQKDILVEHYQQLERQGVIQELKVRELFSLGRHLSLAAYELEIG